MPTWVPYLEGAHQWLNPGDNAWQMTAATFVGLMSLPGLAVLYGGVMQKRWSVNSMMLTFAAFSLVLVAWVLWAFKMGFGSPIGSGKGFFDTTLPFRELRRRSRINNAAQAADDSPDFSQRIRSSLPPP